VTQTPGSPNAWPRLWFQLGPYAGFVMSGGVLVTFHKASATSARLAFLRENKIACPGDRLIARCRERSVTVKAEARFQLTGVVALPAATPSTRLAYLQTSNPTQCARSWVETAP
jgi:hypothetical protein